jgi:hypothetical protein
MRSLKCGIKIKRGRGTTQQGSGSVFGPELMASFVNGSTAPLNTLITSGVDITSGIATAPATGCVGNPAIPVTISEKYRLTIDTVTINSFTGNGLKIAIVVGAFGNTVAVSDVILIDFSCTDFTHTFTIDTNDPVAYLQIGAGAGSTVDFAALGISLNQSL